MRQQTWKRYGIGAGGMLVLVTAFLLATGWGSAVAAQVSSVFVSNDSAHPVPVQEQRTDANGNIKVHEQGTANVNVNGTVSVAPEQPTNAFSYEGFGAGSISPNLPAGANWFISSVSGVNLSDSPQTLGFNLSIDASCEPNSTSSAGPQMSLRARETAELTFPQPFVMRQSADDLCLRVEASSSAVEWTIVGYHD